MRNQHWLRKKKWYSCFRLTRKFQKWAVGSVVDATDVDNFKKISKMEITVNAISEKQFIQVNRNLAPRFISKESLTVDQLHPDYRLHLLESKYAGMNTISCSKCHHCR